MNIGTNDWIRNLNHVAHQMEEVLSLEGTVVVQRATELQVEARKVTLLFWGRDIDFTAAA